MKKLILFITLFTCMPSLGEDLVRSRWSVACIFDAIAERMNVKIRHEIPLPTMIYASQANLEEYNKARRDQGTLEEDEISNIYLKDLNQFYVIDSASYYDRHGRFIEDSIAHELVHYVQVKYWGTDLQEEISAEAQATDDQNWFREKFVRPNVSPCADRK